MKKNWAILLSICSFLVSMNLVQAECSANDLNNLKALANKVTTSFTTSVEKIEIDEEITPPDGYNYMDEDYLNKRLFNIYINNIKEDIYIIVTNSVTKEEKTYTYEDSDNGVITFKDYNVNKIKTYTVDIYATNKECTQKLKSLKIKLPMYNEYSDYGICSDAPNYYLCYEYVNEKVDYSYEELAQMISNYLSEGESKKEEEKDPVKIKEKKNRDVVIIISVASVVIIAGLAFVIIRRRK